MNCKVRWGETWQRSPVYIRVEWGLKVKNKKKGLYGHGRQKYVIVIETFNSAMYTSWGITQWIRPNACQANGHFINDSCKASRPANREWKRAGMHVRTIYLQSTYTCGIQGFKHYMEIIAFKGKTGVFFIFINRTAAPEYRCQLENLTNYKLQSLKFTDRLIRARKS